MSNLKHEVDELLKAFCTRNYGDATNQLHAAMSYALLGSGKRVRAQLALLSCRTCGGDMRAAYGAAIALEMVHAYSLVHDDLPSLDNDSLRRGRPTVHVQFDEATALLAGDALLTDAFRALVDPTFTGAEGAVINAAAQVRCLAQASGGHGMVEGQALDIYWSGREGATLKDLEYIHLNKTARLLGASAAMGAMAAGANTNDVTAFQKFGEDIGLSFQIIDDLLDGSDHTGKSKGKDEEQGKLTYVSLLGHSQAQDLAKHYTDRALSCLATYGDAAEPLRELTLTLLQRNS